MQIIGCDLHARQQTIAMLDTDTGEFIEKALAHEGEELRKFYSGLTRPVLVGIEATGSMQWFLELMEELSIECRVGDLFETVNGTSTRCRGKPQVVPLELRASGFHV